MFRKNGSEKGFTLIELLMVVTIIGLLSTIVIGFMNKTQGRARDTKRISDLNQLNLALQTYWNDHGQPPGCWAPGYEGGCDLDLPGLGIADTTQDGQFLTFLNTLGYLSQPVSPPLNDLGFFYAYSINGEVPPGSGKIYAIILTAVLETENHPLAITLPGLPEGYQNMYVILVQ